MIEWKDASSWSQKDSAEARSVPKTWSTIVGPVRLSVTRHIHYDPDTWVMSCNPPVVMQTPLESADIDRAKEQALEKLHDFCCRVMAEINGIP